MPDQTHALLVASARDLRASEVDDEIFHAALRRVGVDFRVTPWDDPLDAWRGAPLCLIRTTWDYSPRREAFVAWADEVESRSRLLNPAAVVRWNTDKRYLFELESAGLPVPPTVLINAQSPPIAAVMKRRGWTRALLKPVVGANANGTLRFAADHAGLARAQTHVDTQLASGELLLQPYLERVEQEGELSVIVIDGHITHAVQKRPAPGDYRVQDNHGGIDRGVELSSRVAVIVDQVMAYLAERWPRSSGAVGSGRGEGAASSALAYARIDLLQNSGGSLLLNELEVVEPSLFFRHSTHCADFFARYLAAELADLPS